MVVVNRERGNEGLSSVTRELSVSLIFFISKMYLSKIKKSKCGCCSKEMLDGNLRQSFKEVHGKTMSVKGQKMLLFSTTQDKCTKKNRKSDN